MLKNRLENMHSKTLCYRIFHEEYKNKEDFFDLNHLSKVTGLRYIKLYRIIRGDFDFKADDFIKICLALGRADLIARVISELRLEISDRGNES